MPFFFWRAFSKQGKTTMAKAKATPAPNKGKSKAGRTQKGSLHLKSPEIQKKGSKSARKTKPTLPKKGGGSFYIVEKIVDKKMHLGKSQYRVKWKGYDESENTWEPASNLKNVQDLVDKFDLQQKLKEEKEQQQQAPKNRTLFFVDEIVGKRQQAGKAQYLVKWKGFDSSENTWEPVVHLKNVKDLVSKYNLHHESKNSKSN